MKHKHYDMIIAKAANMDLETFIKQEGEWRQMVNAFPMSEHFDYFLCLPQHAESCLHWLNFGQVEVMEHKCNVSHAGYVDYTNDCELQPWQPFLEWMSSCHSFRIKPRKEKRWIGVKSNGYSTLHFETKGEVEREIKRRGFKPELYQIVPIEVEV